MRYQLAPISTRPWLLNGLSLRLIESHYESFARTDSTWDARRPSRSATLDSTRST
jgi:hypothetical protein